MTDTNQNVQEDKTATASTQEAKVEPTVEKTVAQAAEAKTEEKKTV